MATKRKPPKKGRKNSNKLKFEVDWDKAKAVKFMGITAPVLNSSDYKTVILIQKMEELESEEVE